MRAAFNILLAEDNENDVFLLRRAFKKADTNDEFQTVADGLQAVAYLKGDGIYSQREEYPLPDVLLLDLNMPGMNGFEVLEWVRQESDCRSLIVHVLTASSREEDVQRVYSLGANSYIMKPTRLDDLVEFVKALHRWHSFLCLPKKPGQIGGKHECLNPASAVPH